MWDTIAPYEWEVVGLVAITVSVLIGFMNASRKRSLLISGWWLIPFWIALWVTVTEAEQIAFALGDWWVLLVVTPLLLALWGAVTIFPYMLTVRLREIRRGV